MISSGLFRRFSLTEPALLGGVFALAGGTGCGGQELRFATPWLALLFLILPPLLWRMLHRSPTDVAHTRAPLFDGLPPTLKTRLRHAPAILSVVALGLAIVALMRPQLRQFSDETVDGIDIMLAFDMSGSMAAVDMGMTEIRAWQLRHNENPPNRFDEAKRTLKRFVDGRQHDRIGMVVFAKEAYLQFPLTLDYSTIQSLLDRLALTSIDASATAIGNALGLSIRGLLESDSPSRTIILITDGKQQGGNISPVHAAEIAQREGIRIYAILVGSGVETMVPVDGISTRPSRFRPESYPTDPQLLREIAQMTDGAFYEARQPEELEEGLNAILNELEKTRIRDVASVAADELFPAYALASLLVFLLALGLEHLWLRRFP